MSNTALGALMSNSTHLYCLRKSAELYSFANRTWSPHFPDLTKLFCWLHKKRTVQNYLFTEQFLLQKRVRCAVHHQSHSCGLSTVWLCATSFQNAKPLLMSSLLLPFTTKLQKFHLFSKRKTPTAVDVIIITFKSNFYLESHTAKEIILCHLF